MNIAMAAVMLLSSVALLQQARAAVNQDNVMTKMADGGKVYALDADGKRSPKAFTRFDDYEQFVAENTQYVRRRYSYDADGKPFEIEDGLPAGRGDIRGRRWSLHCRLGGAPADHQTLRQDQEHRKPPERAQRIRKKCHIVTQEDVSEYEHEPSRRLAASAGGDSCHSGVRIL